MTLERLRAHFDRLSEIAPADRDAELAALDRSDGAFAAELRALLAAADQEGSSLDRGVLHLPSADEVPSIPGFRIERPLGQGGSATVYLAEQERPGFSRPVALKVIDRVLDRDALRRVREEQRILARLEHSGIARLYDAGLAADGRPFLAMELVHGSTIVEHCRRHALSIDQRLRLGLEVLDAVAYAHGAGVVHRDLKPANILVSDDGAAKLLDFGIAKLIAAPGDVEETRTLLRAMTPAYASPEQLRGERITPASDVYSLGVVLYELLTGILPHRLAAETTAHRASGDSDPEPPSVACRRATRPTDASPIVPPDEQRTAERTSARSSRALRGNLDAVLLKALRRDPAERYASASELAAELRRHLAGRPVLARREVGYRVRSYFRRHRLGFAAAGVALALVGVAALARHAGVSQTPDPRLFPWHWIAFDEPTSQQTYDRALDLRASGSVTAAAAGLRAVVTRHPRAALAWAALADALSNAGRIDEARQAADRGLAVAESLPREAHLLIEALAARESGRPTEAVELLRPLALLDADNVEVALLLGRTQYESGGALATVELAKRLSARPLKERDALRVAQMHLMALDRLGRQKEIAALAPPAAERAIAAELPALAARFLSLAGHAADQLGDSAQAKALLPRIADQAARSGEPRLGALASSLSCYVAIREARHVDVELECGRGLAINRQIGDNRGVAVLTNVLGASRRRRGRLEEARAAFLEAWQVSQRLGDRTLSTRCSNNLANTDLDLGRYEDAERGFREVVELRRVDGDERSRALALRGLANVLLDRGRLRDAEPPLLEAERALRAAKGRELPRILVTLAELRHAEGDRDGALALLDESVALDETGAEPDSAAYGRAMRARFEIALRPERPAPAACLRLSQSSQVLRRLGDRRLADVLAWEGSCLVRTGRADLAAPVIDGGDAAAALSSAPVPRLELALARAELELARRQPEAARRILDRATAESRNLDHVALLFEIRLLAARAESAQSASVDRLRTLLENLREDAHAQRFEAVAREASALLAPLSAAGTPRAVSGTR